MLSIMQMGPVWYTDALAPNQRLVAMALADFADDVGRCWPSMQRVADKTGYSRRQTSRIIKELRDLGYVEVEKEATPRFTPIYRLRPETLAPSASAMEQQAYDHPTFDEAIRTESDEPGEVTILHPGGDRSALGDDTDDTPEVTPVSPKPSENHQEPSETPQLDEEEDLEQDALPIEDIERFRDETTDVIPRPRNPGFDALVYVFGYEPEGSEASLFGKIAAKANRTENPAQEVITRSTRLIAQWEAKALTPASLDKWWQRFGTPLGAATEEEARKLRDDLEAEMRRQRAAELDAEWDEEYGQIEEPTEALGGPEARGHVLDAVTEFDDDGGEN